MALTSRLGVNYQGLFADRPATAGAGDTFFATDTDQFYVWDAVAAAWVAGATGILINPSSSMIWKPDPGGDFWAIGGCFDGLINGVPTAITVPYDTDTGEDTIAVNTVLHNTTRGEKVRVTAVNPTTNVISVEADSPDDASTWLNNEVLSTHSQVNTGRTNGFFDLDITAFLSSSTAQAIFFQATLADTGALSAATLIWHPWVAYSQAKETANLKLPKPPAAAYVAGWGLVPVTWSGGRAYITMGVFWVTTLVSGIMSFLGEF